ncbi:MAG: DUF5076 domain-containing protein [Labilithrix sp.]|nr:DUF5076 domain-containing protein [Labilithrix sp.]
MDELPIPHGAAMNDDSFELARVWMAAGNQHVSLATGVWEDPAAWGIMLVDLARHLAATYEASGMSREAALERIRAGLDAEWSSATDTA